MSHWQPFAGVDPVQESISFDNRLAAEDAKADWVAAGRPEPDEWFADELLAMQAEPIEDPSRYATIDEDYGGLLQESCGPLIQDDRLLTLYTGNAQTYDELLTPEMRATPDELAELESRVPTVAMDPAVAKDARAQIRREAAA